MQLMPYRIIKVERTYDKSKVMRISKRDQSLKILTTGDERTQEVQHFKILGQRHYQRRILHEEDKARIANGEVNAAGEQAGLGVRN